MFATARAIRHAVIVWERAAQGSDGTVRHVCGAAEKENWSAAHATEQAKETNRKWRGALSAQTDAPRAFCMELSDARYIRTL